MSEQRRRRVGWLAALLALGLVAAACGDDDDDDDAATDTTASETNADTGTGDTTAGGSEATGTTEDLSSLSADLVGSGATFPEPLYVEWIGAFSEEAPDVSINYQGIGSSGGREALINQDVAFAGSDAFMNDEDMAAAEEARGCPVVHVPMVHGAVVVAYNIPDLEGLVLDGTTIAEIFLGNITNIDDPAIAALNPDTELPDQQLTVVHRSDGSGTSSIFTKYLTSVDQAWADGPGAGSEIQWPTGIGGDGNDGVAAAVGQNPGGIGYVELSYALETGTAFAAVANADGTPIEASLETTAAATEGIEIPADLRFDVLDVAGEGYPIVGTTWILAYECGYEAGDAAALQAWLRWNLTDGDAIAEDLQYAPLAPELEELSLAAIDLINSQ